jgi:hypothetical protein
MSHGHLPHLTGIELQASVDAGAVLTSRRLPLAQRMRNLMRRQSTDAAQTAEKMARVAENNWSLRKQLGELLRNTSFFGILNEAGIEQLPQMLVSRIACATHPDGPFGGQTLHSAIVQSQRAPISTPPVPARLAVRTTASLARMNRFRRGEVLALMQRTSCFTGDFALALLTATPRDELADGQSALHCDARFVASLMRYERKLEAALCIIDLLAPDYPLMLVERTLHVALGRRLLALRLVGDWLRQRATFYLELLQDARATSESVRTPRRHIRVAE